MLRDRMIQIQNALRLVQHELDLLSSSNINLYGYFSPLANEIIFDYNTTQPYYNNIINVLINNNITYTEHCIQIERINRVIVNYVIKFNIEPMSQLLL